MKLDPEALKPVVMPASTPKGRGRNPREGKNGGSMARVAFTQAYRGELSSDKGRLDGLKSPHQVN
uniref:Uncharacterized protein n=1 Tax=Utricularia reniformis TaxID=192314 RepID=A0A1Y0B2F4_9LAMI|nr:hypothetical protein AEK19_MT1439 [Utricularia reniformis]ART31632.1 hypothetical protein AEK19_MT1439 [Utricularia reniformis]